MRLDILANEKISLHNFSQTYQRRFFAHHRSFEVCRGDFSIDFLIVYDGSSRDTLRSHSKVHSAQQSVFRKWETCVVHVSTRTCAPVADKKNDNIIRNIGSTGRKDLLRNMCFVLRKIPYFYAHLVCAQMRHNGPSPRRFPVRETPRRIAPHRSSCTLCNLYRDQMFGRKVTRNAGYEFLGIACLLKFIRFRERREQNSSRMLHRSNLSYLALSKNFSKFPQRHV